MYGKWMNQCPAYRDLLTARIKPQITAQPQGGEDASGMIWTRKSWQCPCGDTFSRQGKGWLALPDPAGQARVGTMVGWGP